MTKQEEQLWNYIDGHCGEAERAEIAKKLSKDKQLKQLYVQLLEVNQLLETHLDIDEPSMSFNRNVMERVKHEIAPVKLKTKVDSRFIYAIVGFFAFSLVSILAYAIATAVPIFTLKASTFSLAQKFDGWFDTKVLMIFLFVNAVLLLIYLDGYFRRGIKKEQSSN